MIVKDLKKEVTKTRYVAEDDMEFATEEACKEYEESEEGKIAILFHKIPKVEINTVDFGIPYNADYFEAYLISPQNMEEITVLNLFMEQITGESKFFTSLSVGRTFIFNLGESRDWCDVYYAGEYIEHLKGNLKEYITKINEKTGKDE